MIVSKKEAVYQVGIKKGKLKPGYRYGAKSASTGKVTYIKVLKK